LGGGNSASALPALPGALPVLNLELQVELLQRANFTITHSGVNTVLELHSCAVPMEAIPIAEVQPGVATPVDWSGCCRPPAHSVAWSTLQTSWSR
jgi:UDP:flavonoid glycosyltransferase YjiC (YdhE family)